jgi:hypothetical protein
MNSKLQIRSQKERKKAPTAILELTIYSPASYYLRLYNQFTMVACTLPVARAETQALCPLLSILVASQPALRYLHCQGLQPLQIRSLIPPPPSVRSTRRKSRPKQTLPYPTLPSATLPEEPLRGRPQTLPQQLRRTATESAMTMPCCCCCEVVLSLNS